MANAHKVTADIESLTAEIHGFTAKAASLTAKIRSFTAEPQKLTAVIKELTADAESLLAVILTSQQLPKSSRQKVKTSRRRRYLTANSKSSRRNEVNPMESAIFAKLPSEPHGRSKVGGR